MFGLNKKGSVQRLIDEAYSPHIDLMRFRSEQSVPSNRKYLMREDHITHKMFCDIKNDIKTADRIIYGEKEYVIRGVKRCDDSLGKHLEVFMREIASEVHQNILILNPEELQESYNPVLKEYVGNRIDDGRIIKVLIDPVEAAKNQVVQYMEPGRLDGIDYIMTVDFPEKLTLDTKIFFNDIEHDIKWIYEDTYQYRMGLVKSVINYKDNED